MTRRRWNPVTGATRCHAPSVASTAATGYGTGMETSTPYATREDLLALRADIIEKMGEMETRLVRDMATREWRMFAVMAGLIAAATAIARIFG